MFPVVKREKITKTKVSTLKLMFFTAKSYQRVAVHLQHFLNDCLKSFKILKTEKVRCFLLLVKGLSAIILITIVLSFTNSLSRTSLCFSLKTSFVYSNFFSLAKTVTIRCYIQTSKRVRSPSSAYKKARTTA